MLDSFAKVRKLAVAAAAAVALIIGTASPAGAVTLQGIYFDGYSGSDRQCAWWKNFSLMTHPHVFYATARTSASHGTGCATQFGLPYNWLEARSAVQVVRPGGWYTANESFTAENQAGSHTTGDALTVGAGSPGELWRSVTAHNALLAGGWRLTVQAGPVTAA